MRQKFFYFASYGILVLFFFNSCISKNSPTNLNEELGSDTIDVYDLDAIEESGELIAITISGPETYYQYHHVDMGLEFLLAENYANTKGVRIRMEIAKDTAELFYRLAKNEVDLIAYELPTLLIKEKGFLAVGTVSDTSNASWSVRKTSPLLAASLDEWYSPSLRVEQKKNLKEMMNKPRVQHSTLLKPYIPNRKGAISPYDSHFSKVASSIGWDWRLLAAQCYQESAFDPEAVSWAGAKGLMQIMPGTARQLGVPVSSLFQPDVNISAAAKYIKMLQHQFSDIKNPAERTKFVLAAYNGGSNHIRDAMALARKYHRNPHSWSSVGFYVLHLADSRYYNDPVVKYGYMIGSETYNYVQSIIGRWYQYRTGAKVNPSMSQHIIEVPNHSYSVKAHKKNRFTNTSSKIISRNDSIFKID